MAQARPHKTAGGRVYSFLDSHGAGQVGGGWTAAAQQQSDRFGNKKVILLYGTKNINESI